MGLHDKTQPETSANANSQAAQSDEQIMWHLVAEISQGLQISFASIKAAISSLLGGDIFWDQATQHEFMQTIDKGVDEISELTAVMTLAMRFKSHSLTIHGEPNSLQEIISQAKDLVQKQWPNVTIHLALPAETRLAFVDFEYLRTALRLLLEVLLTTENHNPTLITLELLENPAEGHIIITGDFTSLTQEVIHWLCYHTVDHSTLPTSLRAETKLKASVASQLLFLQTITIVPTHAAAERTSLVLSIPFATET